MGSRVIWVRPRVATSQGYESERGQGDRYGGSVQPGRLPFHFSVLCRIVSDVDSVYAEFPICSAVLPRDFSSVRFVFAVAMSAFVLIFLAISS